MILAYHGIRAPPKDYNRLIVIVPRMPSRIRMCVRMCACLASCVLFCLPFFRAPPMDYNRLIVIVARIPSCIRMCVRICACLAGSVLSCLSFFRAPPMRSYVCTSSGLYCGIRSYRQDLSARNDHTHARTDPACTLQYNRPLGPRARGFN